MKFHEVVDIFPMMSADEFNTLKTDIAENGQREPIWIYKGQIIDGRNRYKACEALGLNPVTQEWDGTGSLTLFVVSMNLHRRHLNSSQKAVVGEEIEKRLAIEAKEKEKHRKTKNNVNGNDATFENFQKSLSIHAAEQAAVAVGANAHYIVDVKKLPPDIKERVKKGEINIPAAKREMKVRETALVRNQAASSIKKTNSQIIVGDFWNNAEKIPDNSIALIFTDPPYNKEAEKLLTNLAEFAARKLAPGGSALFYIGHLQLPATFKAFEGKLRYWWMCATFHNDDLAIMKYYGIRVGWKPIIWFVKESRYDNTNLVVDTMISSQKEKKFHDWQQPEYEASYWIEKLCPPDGIVCDPFLGGGTTAAAAQRLKRKWIGFEINPETARIASARLEGK